MLAVEQRVQHGHFQAGAVGNGGFARFQVNLHAVLFGKLLQAGTEGFQGVTFAGKVNAATQADPLNLMEQMTKLGFDLAKNGIETLEAVIFTVVVQHKAGDFVQYGFDFGWVVLAQTAVRARWIG